MATIKELAQASGVSRGTVDRVLHDRGGVAPEIRERVLKAARELGYEPNLAGRMLAVRKNPHLIGVMLPSIGNPFFDDVVRGFESATAEYSDLGFSVCFEAVQGFDVQTHLKAIERLVGRGVDALVVMTMNDSRILSYLSTLDIPIATVNSDLDLEKRLFYVGPDHRKKGAMNAGLLAMVSGGCRRNILILRGTGCVQGHRDIVGGFIEGLDRRGLEYTVSGEYDCQDDDEVAFRIVEGHLGAFPETDTIFISTAGTEGAIRAVGDRDILAFSSDDVPSVRRLLKSGRLAWTICQHPYTQGYRCARKMQQYFIDNKRPDNLITGYEVKIRENVEEE